MGLIGDFMAPWITKLNNDYNSEMQDKANALNSAQFREQMNFNREQFDYQKALQEQIFAREDSAYQREVEDLRNAGLNTQLALGNGGAGAGSVVGTSSSSLNPNTNQAFRAQAPLFGGSSGILETIGSMYGYQLKEQELNIMSEEADTHAFQAETERMKAGFQSGLSVSQEALNKSIASYNQARERLVDAQAQLTGSQKVSVDISNKYKDASEQLALKLKGQDSILNQLKMQDIQLALETIEIENQLKSTKLKFAERQEKSKLLNDHFKRGKEAIDGLNTTWRNVLNTIRTFTGQDAIDEPRQYYYGE